MGISIARKIILTMFTVQCFTVMASAQNRVSDREADGLKGKVQKVTTERAQFTNESGGWVEGKPQLDSVTTYDVAGNRLKREVYDKGELSSVYNYSFLEGDRVVKIDIIRVSYNVGSSGPSGTKPSNPRYTYKFKYKFDGRGNRTEEAWYGNDGSLTRRHVNVYDAKGNRSEWSIYSANSKQAFLRRGYTYDGHGNVIEEASYGLNGSVENRWTYSYEFDQNGNWIKRKRMRLVVKDGESHSEPYDVNYRTIIYF
jgi:hypothetical protein